MANKRIFSTFARMTAMQVYAFGLREKSPAEIRYGNVMRDSAAVLADLTRTGSFDQLIAAEKILQKNDLVVYSKVPSTAKSVQQGMDDLQNGEEVYKQLLHNPKAYFEHKYRDNERASPDRLVPLDAMRRALRGQIKRVENYRKNVMGNPNEREFLSTRIAMLHHAEALYDAIQREHLA